MKIATGIQLTFNLEISPLKHVFKQNITIFLAAIFSFLKLC